MAGGIYNEAGKRISEEPFTTIHCSVMGCMAEAAGKYVIFGKEQWLCSKHGSGDKEVSIEQAKQNKSEYGWHYNMR